MVDQLSHKLDSGEIVLEGVNEHVGEQVGEGAEAATATTSTTPWI
jgi:hypothetical protein